MMVGRLKVGVSLGAAKAEMDGIASRLRAAYPDSNTNVGVRLVPLSEEIFDSGFRLALKALLLSVGLVLQGARRARREAAPARRTTRVDPIVVLR